MCILVVKFLYLYDDRYDLLNYQKTVSKNGTEIFDYVRVGGWDSGNLTIDGQKVFWPNPEGQRGASVVESVCSKPCPKGEVKVTGNLSA